MSGWDIGHVTALNIGTTLNADSFQSAKFPPKGVALQHFRTFLRNCQSSDGMRFPYRDALRENYREYRFYVTVDLDDLSRYTGGDLLSMITERPGEYMPILEEAAKEVGMVATSSSDQLPEEHSVQVLLKNYSRFSNIRTLSASSVSKLVALTGIVISASRARVKATSLKIMCRNCKITKDLLCGSGFGGAKLPRECDSRQNNSMGVGNAPARCPLDPFIIVADQSIYIDQQRLKLQEAPESVPTGEMPRTISLAVERHLVGSVKPGARVTVIGMYTTYEAASAAEKQKLGSNDVGIRIPYVRVFGLESEKDNGSGDSFSGQFSPEEKLQMETLARTPNLYQKIWSSIAPAIFDNEETMNIKRAIACQLFGGSAKELPDGMRLRGDINILLLGDPSVAKSQFLKFAHQVAPVGVYTSGKGSSAAGLTASVIRDPSSGEFHLEGGALVLADRGLVCIDEFDKMRELDRVAIHEAMEQQTISIAKAGITTVLNSRTSVLAAANPVFGRYDDMRTPTDNIDFQTSILSRFDLIFIVRDVQDQRRDERLAKYVIRVHKERDNAVREDKKDIGLVDIPLLRRYISYTRNHCKPKLAPEARQKLKHTYVEFRKSFGEQRRDGANGGAPATIPITVRQLEAIIRISESLARMENKEEATIAHVDEAIRLFQVSTYRAATSSFQDGGVASAEFDRNVRQAEDEISKRVGIGSSIQTFLLKKHLVERGYEQMAIGKAVDNLVKKGSLVFKAQGKMIDRKA